MSFQVSRPHIQETEDFGHGLKTAYDALVRAQQDDEEIAGYYEGGQGIVRVYGVQMAVDSPVLILTGVDEVGDNVAVVGHYQSMHLIYRKTKLGKDAERKPIGFSK
jgi:hypothetical protein